MLIGCERFNGRAIMDARPIPGSFIRCGKINVIYSKLAISGNGANVLVLLRLEVDHGLT